jgi:hypothetical protein
MVKNFEAKGADRYRASVEKFSAQYSVSPSLVLAVIRTESNFNPFAVSGAPAYGLMQLVPTSGGRAALKRVQGVDQTPTPEFLLDPEHNIELGSAYLGMLNTVDFQAINDPQSRDYCVIAAYNTGARNVTRTFSNDKGNGVGQYQCAPAVGCLRSSTHRSAVRRNSPLCRHGQRLSQAIRRRDSRAHSNRRSRGAVRQRAGRFHQVRSMQRGGNRGEECGVVREFVT